MRWVTALMFTAAILFVGGPAVAGCGDVDGNPPVDLLDLTYMLVYVGDPTSIPTLPNPGDADMDGRAGITFSDCVTLIHYLFGPFEPPYPPFDCSQSKTYTLAASNDSVFFPQMMSVPDGVDTVDLPVITVLESSTRGYYLPFLERGPGIDKFQLNEVLWSTSQVINFPGSGYLGRDTICIEAGAINLDDPNFVGKHTHLKLRYVRTAPGVGSIAPLLVSRSSQLKPSVVKNEDLFIPNILYYAFQFPPETLKVSQSVLAYDAVAGYASADSFVVSFTSSGLPITFELTADDPWLTFVDTGAVGFRTPCNVVVKATAAATGIGDYVSQIHFTNMSPSAPTTVAAIDATMHVRAPNLYPFGDLDCDGIVDIADLTKIIDYLYISMQAIQACQP